MTRRVTLSLLDPEDLERLVPAETHSFPSPIPTRFVSGDEFLPGAQTENQKRVEARIKALGSELLRDDRRLENFVRSREAVGAALQVHAAAARRARDRQDRDGARDYLAEGPGRPIAVTAMW
jgi:hypothetical protein